MIKTTKILYCINPESVIAFGDRQLKKTEKSLDYLRENEIEVIWLVDDDAFSFISILDGKLAHEFDKMLLSWSNVRGCIKDSTSKADEYSCAADAYYGDWNYVSWRCSKLGKPVMIQNVDC